MKRHFYISDDLDDLDRLEVELEDIDSSPVFGILPDDRSE